MVEKLERFAPLAGRILLTVIFLTAGFSKITNWSGTAAYMASRGMRGVPFLLFMAILIEVLGGLSVLTGAWGRWGALVLFLFLIPVTLVFHNFWTYPPPQQEVQMIFFMKNLAIMGGLAMVAAFGPGPLSLDARRAQRKL